ncbi:hypothetical protein [Rhizobium sp.]|uniref:hypothetical protein n=1 Tax=Rhizobium sp. TaxID=391 RepID=UPI002AA7B108
MRDYALLQGKTGAFSVDGSCAICKRIATFLTVLVQILLNTQIPGTVSQFLRIVLATSNRHFVMRFCVWFGVKVLETGAILSKSIESALFSEESHPYGYTCLSRFRLQL